MNEREAEAEDRIFNLRKKADLFLQAGNTEEFERILIAISHLQEVYGALHGAERKNNDRTA